MQSDVQQETRGYCLRFGRAHSRRRQFFRFHRTFQSGNCVPFGLDQQGVLCGLFGVMRFFVVGHGNGKESLKGTIDQRSNSNIAKQLRCLTRLLSRGILPEVVIEVGNSALSHDGARAVPNHRSKHSQFTRQLIPNPSTAPGSLQWCVRRRGPCDMSRTPANQRHELQSSPRGERPTWYSYRTVWPHGALSPCPSL